MAPIEIITLRTLMSMEPNLFEGFYRVELFWELLELRPSESLDFLLKIVKKMEGEGNGTLVVRH